MEFKIGDIVIYDDIIYRVVSIINWRPIVTSDKQIGLHTLASYYLETHTKDIWRPLSHHHSEIRKYEELRDR